MGKAYTILGILIILGDTISSTPATTYVIAYVIAFL